MVEPIEITQEMKESKQIKIDKYVEDINNSIRRAVENGRHDICFPIDKDNTYYWDVRRLFERKGYRIKPTGYIGGVWQLTEDLYW